MSEDKFDAIIVGAGIAGSVAAYVLAKAGANVVVIERGNFAGSKNMTGGRLYAHSLEKIMPGFAGKAPLERKVIKERVSFLTEDSGVTLDYTGFRAQMPHEESYTVLRSPFDRWLMEQAEAAGAQWIPGTRVDEVITEDGKVVGVQADGESLEANVVILADGVNSLLGEKLGMVKPIKANAAAVGVKELLELHKDKIQNRFNLKDHEGACWLFAGFPSNGKMGGGFLYTNQSSLSLGVVCGLQHIESSSKTVPQMMEDFKNHPLIRPLIEGAQLREYSAHVVPEAGINMLPELVRDGVIIIGDAAGLCLNLGYTIRGMDLAVTSGEAAALTVLHAKERNDFSKTGLSSYQTLLDESYLMKDLKQYQKLPLFLENPRIFNHYPKMAADFMADLFTVDGTPAKPLYQKVMSCCQKGGYLNLIKDAICGVRAI
ncbi:MAG: FAD-dependent oxidoreductase [Burkholderiales bacterium]|jgi:electron transfer flavoprotein-quinone oxidoreductase|nr:FAD-dependent oxidoreductase [Burkholderiales bacterium]